MEFVHADVLNWRPSRRYDVVFFGFWLSHVPSERYADFWTLLGDCIVDGGQVVFVDEHVRSAGKESWLAREVVQRTLADGSTHRVVKAFLDPAGGDRPPGRARLALGCHGTGHRLGDRRGPPNRIPPDAPGYRANCPAEPPVRQPAERFGTGSPSVASNRRWSPQWRPVCEDE